MVIVLLACPSHILEEDRNGFVSLRELKVFLQKYNQLQHNVAELRSEEIPSSRERPDG